MSTDLIASALIAPRTYRSLPKYAHIAIFSSPVEVFATSIGDAYYARLYGLTRDELRYILDPKDVYGEDFPGETFRVLKEKEIKQYGEHRTRRLVPEKWDAMVGER